MRIRNETKTAAVVPAITPTLALCESPLFEGVALAVGVAGAMDGTMGGLPGAETGGTEAAGSAMRDLRVELRLSNRVCEIEKFWCS